MIDIINEINAVYRSTGPGSTPAGVGRTVALRRSYDAPIEDVWDAVTTADRINRWFMPITGDLRLGGRYQLKGNAGGEILRCEPPHLVKVTWVLGEAQAEAGASEVEVRLSAGTDGETVLELEHTAIVDPKFWTEYGPGAVGVGWDLALLGLGLHLRGESIEDPDAWTQTAEARQFITGSSNAWGAANLAAGATSEEAASAAENTTAFYAPDPNLAAQHEAGG